METFASYVPTLLRCKSVDPQTGAQKTPPQSSVWHCKGLYRLFLALVIDQVLKCYNSRKHSISRHRAQDEIIIDQGSLGQVDVWDSVHRYDVDRCIVVDVHVVAPIRCSDEEGSIIVSVHLKKWTKSLSARLRNPQRVSHHHHVSLGCVIIWLDGIERHQRGQSHL